MGDVLPLPEPSPSEVYVRMDELARIMGVSRSTIKRWVRLGMPSETWGLRARYFEVSKAVAWARARGRIAA